MFGKNADSQRKSTQRYTLIISIYFLVLISFFFNRFSSFSICFFVQETSLMGEKLCSVSIRSGFPLISLDGYVNHSRANGKIVRVSYVT